MFLEKNIKGPYILLVCIIINYYFGKWGGIKAYFAALSLSANVTFSINSVLHTFGYRNFYNDNSRNFILYLPLLMGDHLHNNHHKTCFCVNNRVKWYEFDPAYIIFCILEKFKLIKNLQHSKINDTRRHPGNISMAHLYTNN